MPVLGIKVARSLDKEGCRCIYSFDDADFGISLGYRRKNHISRFYGETRPRKPDRSRLP